ncbi:unnamed protein product, partial [Phaeothamnion confervicola]
LFVDVLLLADFGLRFNRAYVDRQGNLVADAGRIARRYARGYLLVDAIAAVPMSLVGF